MRSLRSSSLLFQCLLGLLICVFCVCVCVCMGWAVCCHSVFISPHCLGNSSQGSIRVWIHHPPLIATVTLPLPAIDTVRP
ncbi:unnamed protein product [Staurois parvus]|uniref:Secreted protein n=1 Tax=Staurois parvus TaxID=386267 RepID=A0ABN9DP25_9NEOB|nr:unnamed protein product [Staurois parvus]